VRQYSFQADATGPDGERETTLPERMKFSSPVMLGSIEFGPSTNSFIHLWPYASMERRLEIRGKAAATGKWPPAGGRDRYLVQSNKLLLPASFSPAQ
jgi:hypothetical protein